MVLAAETGGQTSASPSPDHYITGFPTGSIVHDAGTRRPSFFFFFFFFFDDPRFPELAAARAGGLTQWLRMQLSSVPKATAFRGPQSLFRVSSPEADSIATGVKRPLLLVLAEPFTTVHFGTQCRYASTFVWGRFVTCS